MPELGLVKPSIQEVARLSNNIIQNTRIRGFNFLGSDGLGVCIG
jgi:hypothetical protein